MSQFLQTPLSLRLQFLPPYLSGFVSSISLCAASICSLNSGTCDIADVDHGPMMPTAQQPLSCQNCRDPQVRISVETSRKGVILSTHAALCCRRCTAVMRACLQIDLSVLPLRHTCSVLARAVIAARRGNYQLGKHRLGHALHAVYHTPLQYHSRTSMRRALQPLRCPASWGVPHIDQ